MFNKMSIKIKLLTAVISTIVLISVISEVKNMVSIKENTNSIIEQT